MAIKDVKIYYYNVLSQYLEMKNDLKDFEQAFADGHITEDRLDEVRHDIEQIEDNYKRISFILYLLAMPKRKGKKEQYIKAQNVLTDYFEKTGHDMDAVLKEDEDVLKHLKATLKKLSEEE
jgi:trans-2-enoyl-CoA reductase